MTNVKITPLKEKAMAFPEPLKSLILSEPDLIDAEDFILKFGTWDRLAKFKNGGL